MDYQSFLKSKKKTHLSEGLKSHGAIHPSLFPFQRDLVSWALRKGRAAIFADTGLGKTRIQLEYARLTNERVLIVAPLSIAKQTVREAAQLGIDLAYNRDGQAAGQLTITNYEHAHKFNADDFGCVVIDESSCLKSIASKTREQLTKQWQKTRFRLCCTATPSPNDISELGNHSDFLSVMPRAAMLATFFLHDSAKTQEWRLKRHAEEPFFEWMASWGITLRIPSDLGYSDNGYILPPLSITPEFVGCDYVPEGELFFDQIKGLGDRLKVRQGTVANKVNRCAELATATNDQYLIWGGLNNETTALHRAIPGSIHVEGSDSPEYKAEMFEAFQSGKIRVLVTKALIAGFGMNFQNCHRQIFCGLNDSFELFYQAIRRSYRFGQLNPVDVRVVITEAEDAIYRNVLRKEAQAAELRRRLIECIRKFEIQELRHNPERHEYFGTVPVKLPKWIKAYAMPQATNF